MSSSVGSVVQHVRSRCPCSGVWHLALFLRIRRDNDHSLGGLSVKLWKNHPRKQTSRNLAPFAPFKGAEVLKKTWGVRHTGCEDLSFITTLSIKQL